MELVLKRLNTLRNFVLSSENTRLSSSSGNLFVLLVDINQFSVDNVGSNQMHQIRQSLRGDAVILCGKNTMIRRAIRGFINEFPDYERLLPYVKGNIGFVFTNKDLKEVREKITANRVAAPARAGAVAPLDVFIPASNTGLDPSKTSFFQGIDILIDLY